MYFVTISSKKLLHSTKSITFILWATAQLRVYL